MHTISEILRNEIDPIEDVRRRFELFYTSNYFDPQNGDWISDDYLRIIDLTTKPGNLNEDDKGKLNRSIIRLNEKYDYVESMLGSSSLLGAYIDAVVQINTINSADPDRESVAIMHAAQTTVAA